MTRQPQPSPRRFSARPDLGRAVPPGHGNTLEGPQRNTRRSCCDGGPPVGEGGPGADAPVRRPPGLAPARAPDRWQKRSMVMRLSTLIFSAIVVFAVASANAAAKPGVAWDCAPEFELFIIYAVATEQHDMPDGDRVSWQTPGEDGLVTACEIGPRRLELHRLFTNTPRARGGACAGVAWSQYELRSSGTTVASFHLGCIDALIRGYHGVLAICLDGENTCRVRHWDQLRNRPFRGNVFGRWLDDP